MFIELTNCSGGKYILNTRYIASISIAPKIEGHIKIPHLEKSKILMDNGEQLLVQETYEELVQKLICERKL